MNKSNLLRFNRRETKTKGKKQKGKVIAFPTQPKFEPEKLRIFVGKPGDKQIVYFADISSEALQDLADFIKASCLTHPIPESGQFAS
jgi:hypothetical protein